MSLASALTLGASYVASDLTAQWIIEKRRKIDVERVAKFALIGTIWVGPYVNFCLGAIARFTKRWPTRVLLDQTLLMPVNMSVVNAAKPLMDGKSLEESFKIWKVKTPKIIQNGWFYWTPVSIILFTLIKSQIHRNLVFTFFAYFWQCYLAFKVSEELN